MTTRRPTYTAGARRRRNRNQSRLGLVVVLIVCAIFFAAEYLLGYDRESRRGVQFEGDLTYVTDTINADAQIVNYEGMTVSFNPKLHIPNWVAWELTADEAAGVIERSNAFINDPDVEGCPTTDDYRNSGYDRGHMAPAGDMKWSQKAMDQSFYLTNIVPQAGELNKGAWKKVEDKCRARVMPGRKGEQRDSAIVIVCGPMPGQKPIEHIGANRVAVPRSFFKVILAPYAKEPYAIGFIMPNGHVEGGMQAAAVSVDEVERLTGYDFFSALPDDEEARLESQFNFQQWSRLQ